MLPERVVVARVEHVGAAPDLQARGRNAGNCRARRGRGRGAFSLRHPKLKSSCTSRPGRSERRRLTVELTGSEPCTKSVTADVQVSASHVDNRGTFHPGKATFGTHA